MIGVSSGVQMNKFKIGDKVKCIKNIQTCITAPKKGEEFIITSLSERHIGFPLDRLSSYYKYEVRRGKSPNWGIDNFELVNKEKERHYRWVYSYPLGSGIKKTQHYISESKIEDYFKQFLKIEDIPKIGYNKIEKDFVED